MKKEKKIPDERILEKREKRLQRTLASNMVVLKMMTRK